MEVEFFDSLEAAQARLRQAMDAADARVKPWQAAVKVGDCFIADGGEEDLVVFGEVLEGYQEVHLRHYRFCRCFSVACPEGEVGDVHVSTILAVVSRAFFEAMRQAGWQMEAGQAPGVPGKRKLASNEDLLSNGLWLGQSAQKFLHLKRHSTGQPAIPTAPQRACLAQRPTTPRA